MSSSASMKQNSPKKPLFTRFLDTVEYLGNLLPHPITLFAIFCLAILVMSGIAGYFEVSVVDPRPEGAPGRAADGMIQVVSLLNAEGLQLIVTNLVKNFVGFAPLGTVLVAMLGVAIAEHSDYTFCCNARSCNGRISAHGYSNGCFRWYHFKHGF